MTRTPDDFPGERIEDSVLFLSSSFMPTNNGETSYVSGTGFRFFEEGTLRGLGLDEPTHEKLNTLAHDVVTSSYDEVTYDANFNVSTLTTWTSPAKTLKYQDYSITYASNRTILVVTSSAYDVTGSLKSQMIEVPTYNGMKQIVNITRTRVL